MKKLKLIDIAPYSGKRVKPFHGFKRYMSTGGLKDEDLSFTEIDFANKPSRADIEVQEGDVLFAKMTNTNKALLIDKELNGIIVSTGFSVHRPKKNELDGEYLLHYLRHDYFHRQKNKLCTGAIQSAISNKGIEKIMVPVPSFPDQRHIANILSKAGNLIAQRKETLSLLDEFLKSTFLEMFGDPVRNEKGWETRTIEQLVKKEKYALKRGPFGGALKKEIFVPSGYLVYEQFHALNNDFSFARYFIDEAKFQELKGFEVKPGDIIVSCSGVYLGKLAIVPKGAKQGIINQALLKISLDNRIIENVFFVYVFSNENFKRKFYGNVIGTGIPNFPSMDDFKKFNFIYPPIELQTQFAQIVEKTDALKTQYQQSLQELENMYGSLSQKAFKGELSVKENNLMMAAEPNIEYKML